MDLRSYVVARLSTFFDGWGNVRSLGIASDGSSSVLDESYIFQGFHPGKVLWRMLLQKRQSQTPQPASQRLQTSIELHGLVCIGGLQFEILHYLQLLRKDCRRQVLLGASFQLL